MPDSEISRTRSVRWSEAGEGINGPYQRTHLFTDVTDRQLRTLRHNAVHDVLHNRKSINLTIFEDGEVVEEWGDRQINRALKFRSAFSEAMGGMARISGGECTRCGTEDWDFAPFCKLCKVCASKARVPDPEKIRALAGES